MRYTKQGDIVDEICRLAGIVERHRSGSPTLTKKEALQVLACVRTLKRLVDPERREP